MILFVFTRPLNRMVIGVKSIQSLLVNLAHDAVGEVALVRGVVVHGERSVRAHELRYTSVVLS